MARELWEIAKEIQSDWQPMNYGAAPYVGAMLNLGTINDSYFFDSGEEIVRRFLVNAQSWRGEVARRIKAELKSML